MKWDTQSSQAMKAIQNSTLSDKDGSEDSAKFVAFAAGVERLATPLISRRNDNSEDVASCNSSLAPKDKTESDHGVEYDLALYDLIKAKKCNIMLLKSYMKAKGVTTLGV